MSYTPGSLVSIRGREWVVLPDSTPELLKVRPLGGADIESTAIYLPLEGHEVLSAEFTLPDPTQPGDYRATRLLRDAVRLSFRSAAGPFRSFARVNVEPRPYQLVPLLMALRLNPVRMLIADDVGIGKTIEAGLITREMLDRGEINRFTVLCPPHLVEQWQSELRDKFHMEAVVVLPGTVARLERGLGRNESLFERYPFTIVSTDYVKSERHRDDFVRLCPPLVIVDEAHTCAFTQDKRGGRHLRYQLLEKLATDPARHLLLVTATPHSGNEGAFRSLLVLLNPNFRDLPPTLSGKDNEKHREALARHFIQRKRGDVLKYMDADTPFPDREEKEVTYRLTPDYHRLFADVLEYARTAFTTSRDKSHRERVRWWSILSLLRSLGSSPTAAAASLLARAGVADTESSADADVVGALTVMDLDDAEAGDHPDFTPGADAGDFFSDSERKRLRHMAEAARLLCTPKQDAKLKGIIDEIKALLAQGYQPIIFCRFIATADYVAEHLRTALAKEVEIQTVTGMLAPPEREERVRLLGEYPKRVLVATDCLSEGVNLQAYFNAVIHYDLSWNPTRHEQREGRVDRFGQKHPKVQMRTCYGSDNEIDRLVIRVLLRKHQAIRKTLGVSVPVPVPPNEIMEQLVQGLLLGQPLRGDDRQLSFDLGELSVDDIDKAWDTSAEREKQSRTLYAHGRVDVSEVEQEWRAMREAVGTHEDVKRFVVDGIRRLGGTVSMTKDDSVKIELPEQRTLLDALGTGEQHTFRVAFDEPVPDGAMLLNRTHPWVEGLATSIMEGALDSERTDGVARRCGAIRTRAVAQRTTLLLLRLRFHIVAKRGDAETALLAEESGLMAFRGAPTDPQWLLTTEAENLLAAQPDENMADAQITNFVRQVTDKYQEYLRDAVQDFANQRGQALLAAHQRVRKSAEITRLRYEVRKQPPDVIGVFVLLPVQPVR